MRTLIVLCAGDRTINGIPVYLNRHPDGKLLVEKAMEGIYCSNYDRVVITILEAHDTEYKARNLILNEVSNNIEVFILKEQTSGPAESTYKTIKGANISGEFAVRDSLNGIIIEKDLSGNFLAGLDLTRYESDIYNVKSKSFILANEQDQVLDVVEKRFRSDVISVGFYGFKKSTDFLLAYEKLNDSSYPIGKLYISNIISYLIGYKQRVFHYIRTVEYEDWGYPETWTKMQKDYSNIFVNADSILGEMLTDKTVDCLIERLFLLRQRKNTIIVFTGSKKIDKDILLDKMSKASIHCAGIICGVSCSDEQIIISQKKQITTEVLGGWC